MTPNKVMYRAFLTTLKGVARVWFSKIPLGIIANFEQLRSVLFVISLGGKDARSQPVIFSTFNR